MFVGFLQDRYMLEHFCLSQFDLLEHFNFNVEEEKKEEDKK